MDDAVIPVPAKLLKRLLEVDFDELGAMVDSDDPSNDDVYADIDAIQALLPYAEVEIA